MEQVNDLLENLYFPTSYNFFLNIYENWNYSPCTHIQKTLKHERQALCPPRQVKETSEGGWMDAK